MIVITPALAAAGLGFGSSVLGVFGQGAQRKGAQEALDFQSNLFDAQQEAGADLLAGQFGARERAADADYARQLKGSIESLNLMNSAPYINNMTRTAGFQLAGRGMAPDQIARFNQMFGGT